MIKQILLLGVALYASAVGAAEYLVKYTPVGYAQVLATHGLVVKDVNSEADLIKIDVPKNQLVQVIASLYRQGGIEYIVPNIRMHAFASRIESMALKEQWHLAKIRAEEAWGKAGNRGSKNITVAVIDTGVDYNHPALAPNMVPGYDFHQDDSDPMDITGSQNPGHGTHCAGIIGATGVIEEGTIGISPEVSIMPIRFLGEDGGGDLNNGIKAIDLAISKKVDIISASWGAAVSRAQAKPLLEAIERAEKAGVIFVAAAGNDGKNNDSYEVYPANAGFENFISVAASGPNDEKPQWSDYGPSRVHLASPGLNIVSTIPNGSYQTMSGTSMATPLVSGLVAFLKAQDPSLTGKQVKAILQTTGAKVQIATQCDCRIDALSAAEMVVDKKMYLVPAAGTYKPNESFHIESFNAQGDVQYQSTNESVLKVAADGTVTSGSLGEAMITATDASGNKVSSLTFKVKEGSDPGGPGGPGEPGNPGLCPIQDPATCEALCAIMPEAPWCQK